jgi:hypothetical protein
MEKDEAIELIDQLNEFIHELKLGIGAFILPPTGWGSSEEVGWNVLIDTSARAYRSCNSYKSFEPTLKWVALACSTH